MKTNQLMPPFLMVLVFFSTCFVFGDWNPGDAFKMHYPQMPDVNGWDVAASQNIQYPPITVADDWMCTETGWVKDIHFWGSWMHGQVDIIQGFIIGIYSDVPAPPYSHPGQPLWQHYIQNFIFRPYPPFLPQGWYNPSTNEVIPGDHVEYFQYNIFLPESLWFHQTAGTVYWLSITAIMANPMTMWGWKTSMDHWNDFAVWSTGLTNWEPLFDPMMQTPLDMAFVITGDTIPPSTCPPYLPGDINGDGLRLGSDVTYGVRYFKSLGPQPPDSCFMDSTGTYLYVAGDVNGNCEFRGADITRLVAYFKGIAILSYCHFFPVP
jgi:hypothetical protein